ncbi:hypothetical protein EDD22DRAFT_912743 [Suillus occidentalis]|nr:hypothetical protein EDD22DRAFT_912743 [Suillus occidentalis]
MQAPLTPPPSIDYISHYLQCHTTQHKPYRRDGPTTQERRYAETQLFSQASTTQPDEQGGAMLKRRLECLSSWALAQATLTKEADVEWRRLRTLTTAWEIYALEQHQKFLQMVQEDDGSTYASASVEPLEGGAMPKRRLECLSSRALAQATLTKEADVEWRRLRTLTTAWEIYALEQHQKFLQMVLEDDGETYASASVEPLAATVEALSNCSTEELQERIDNCKAVYDSDETSFAAGHSQLDLMEDISSAHFTGKAEDS